jgi:hypothetical protein
MFGIFNSKPIGGLKFPGRIIFQTVEVNHDGECIGHNDGV